MLPDLRNVSEKNYIYKLVKQLTQASSRARYLAGEEAQAENDLHAALPPNTWVELYLGRSFDSAKFHHGKTSEPKFIYIFRHNQKHAVEKLNSRTSAGIRNLRPCDCLDNIQSFIKTS